MPRQFTAAKPARSWERAWDSSWCAAPRGDSRFSEEEASHLEKSKPVLMPAWRSTPFSKEPTTIRPPSRHVLGMMAVSTALRSTP